jgi:hypothetical protein
VLQLNAVAALSTGQVFKLPQLYPRNVAWQEGTADLLVPSTLVLEQLLTTGCRESRVATLPAPLAGESIQLQYFEATAQVELRLAEPRQRLDLMRGTVVQIGSNEISSRTTIAVAAKAGARRELQIPVASEWTVDAVESLSPNRTVEWDLAESDGKSSLLKIALYDVERVAIQGHRALPESETFDAGALLMLDGTAIPTASPLVNVRSADGLELRWTGRETLQPLDQTTISGEQRALFGLGGDGSIYLDDERFTQAGLSIQRRKASYAADIHIDAVVQQGSLTETFRIQCTPEAVRVDRLLVHVSQPRETPLEWSLAGGNNSGTFSARKLSAGEQTESGIRTSGEVWELLLGLTRPGAFELRAQRTVPFKAETPLAFVSVHEAATQRGTLAIRALGDCGLAIKNRGLMSVPAELLDDDRYQTARATYHYQPSGDESQDEAIVSIAPAAPQQAETGAWAWSVDLSTRYAADGVTAHQADIEIETAGHRRVLVELPAEIELHALSIDSRPLASAQLPKEGSKWIVDLPPGRSHATLRLEYASREALPGLAAVREPVFPQLDIPVVRRQWTVWLPPEYRVGEVVGMAQIAEVPSLSWSQRLFGPLGRGHGDHVFNPLLPADWRDVFTARSDANKARQVASDFVQSIGTVLGNYQDGEELTWGQLLFAAAEGQSQIGRTLLVDVEGLRSAGITPQTRVEAAISASPPERGDMTLRQAGLVVVMSPTSTLLSARPRLSHYDETSVIRGELASTAIARGRLAEQMGRGTGGGADAPYQSIALWRAAATANDSLPLENQRESLGAFATLDPGQWHSYTLPCGLSSSPSVRMVHTSRMRSLVWAVFLGVVALGLWRRAARPWGLLALIAAAAAVALMLPAAYAPIASAVLLASLCCLAARLVRIEPVQPAQNDRSRSMRKPTSSIIHPVSTALLMAALVNTAASLDAAPPSVAAAIQGAEAKAPAKATAVHTVLVPIDAQQQPVDGKYYVPDALYESLLRQTSLVSGQPQQWIVSRAKYRGTLTRDPLTSRLRLPRLNVRFDVHVFQNNARVQIPLSREIWAPTILTARVDGKNRPLVWNAAGDAIVAEIKENGSHRIDLEILPVLHTEPRRAGFDLPIPKLSQAELELSVPSDVTNVEVPTATGRVEVRSERSELLAQLGAADRLSVRWPSSASGTTETPPNLEVEELVWIKVRPGTTVLDARFKYKVLSGRVRTLRLLTDPRLRLLTSPAAPTSAAPSPVAAVHTIPGDPQRVELELAQPISDQVTIDLSFLVTDASGVGNLRLPRLEATEARSARRWLGVTVDPALEHRVQAGEDSRAVDAAEYATAWGMNDAKPERAYSIPRGEPIWFLATQPSEPQLSVKQVTALGLGKAAASVRFDATLNISRGVLAQLAIQGPQNFAIDQVSVRDDEVERVARWSVDESGRISVFLTTPIEGSQQLALRGRWRPDVEQSIEIPRWKVLAAKESECRLQLYRQPGVMVAIEAPADAIPVELAPADRQAALGALCGSYEVQEDSPAIRVKLSPNEPKLSAVATTVLERDSERWTAELQFHADVTEGLVDTLQFEIPPQWSEPFRVEPEMPLSVVSLPGELRRRLTLTPDKPLAGKQVIKLRGRVASSPGDRLSAPDIVPLNAAEIQRFVVLPRKLDAQQVTWDTLRLAPASLPTELQPRSWHPEAVAVYKVIGDHFQASLKAVKMERVAATARLMDVHLAWLPDGSYCCAASIDIEPGGATYCDLEMPPGSTLIHAAIERLPAVISPVAKGRSRLALGPQQLPQRIELLYTGVVNQRQLQPPKLVDVKVQQTLWTLYRMPTVAVRQRGADARTSSSEQQLIRLENVSALVELPSEVIGEHLPEEVARWYDGWRRRYETDRHNLQLELIAAGREVIQSEESITARRLDQRMQSIDERLAAPQNGLRPVDHTSVRASFVDAFASGMETDHFSTRDPSGALPLEASHVNSGSATMRWLAALVLALAAIAILWRMRGRTFPQLNPWAGAAIAAFAWWLLLTPSFLGLLVLALIAAAQLWGGSPRTLGSTSV